MYIPDKGEHVRGKDREELVKYSIKLYKSGRSIREIGKQLNRSYSSIHRLLEENGVALRSKGGKRR